MKVPGRMAPKKVGTKAFYLCRTTISSILLECSSPTFNGVVAFYNGCLLCFKDFQIWFDNEKATLDSNPMRLSISWI
jgi:hypothetical protein